MRLWNIFATFIACTPLFGQDPAVWPLWESPIPLEWAESPPEAITERSKTNVPNRSVRDVNQPILTLYTPPKEKNKGLAIVICPGGGYGHLAYDKEGHLIAKKLTELGITGAVLKYRLPRPGKVEEGHTIPLVDAKQAIRLLRSKAGEIGVNPKKIGVMGFSAGGHLAASVSNLYSLPTAGGKPGLESVSARPDFTVLVYPVISFGDDGHRGSAINLLGPSPDGDALEQWSMEKRVSRDTPPTFLVHAANDPVKIQNSELYRDACLSHGIPVGFYRLSSGGHGFGLGKPGDATSRWPDEMAAFLKPLFLGE